MDVRYFKAGSRIIEFGEEALDWYVVRSGAVEIFRNGIALQPPHRGRTLRRVRPAQSQAGALPAAALEDSLLYLIPEAVFTELFEENNEQFADLVEVEDRTRLRRVVSRREDANQLMSATVDTLVGREPVMLGREATTGMPHGA